jgi:5-hydroxyisourate hydrolase
MSVTTHVLDLRAGRPAAGVRVALDVRDGDGAHQLVFDTRKWFADQGVESFYPEVSVVFEVLDPSRHFHVPLLLSPFGVVEGEVVRPGAPPAGRAWG